MSKAAEKSLYTGMDESIAAGIIAMEKFSGLSLEFSTSAEGGLNATGHGLRAIHIIGEMNRVYGHSPSSINEAFSHLLKHALESHRPVTQHKSSKGSYTTIIGPKTPVLE